MKIDVHFWSYLAQFFLEWKMFQTGVVDKLDVHILCWITFVFLKSYRLWDNVEIILEKGRPQMTIWRMRIACWITKATNAHTDCVILIVFPVQQWSHEGASMLLYTYIACHNFRIALSVGYNWQDINLIFNLRIGRASVFETKCLNST